MTEKVSIGGLPVGGGEPILAGAVRWGDLLFLSGRAAVDPETLAVTADDFVGQATFVLEQIGDVLRAAGSGPEHALRVVCYLADRRYFEAWNRLYREFFPSPRPARTTMVADFAVAGLLVEVEVTAGIPPETP